MSVNPASAASRPQGELSIKQMKDSKKHAYAYGLNEKLSDENTEKKKWWRSLNSAERLEIRNLWISMKHRGTNPLEKLSPLWEENENFLDLSLQRISKDDTREFLLLELMDCVSGLRPPHQGKRLSFLAAKLEEHIPALIKDLKGVLNEMRNYPGDAAFRIGQLQRAFEVISLNERVAGQVAEFLYMQGHTLPEEVKELRLGRSTVEAQLHSFKDGSAMDTSSNTSNASLRRQALRALGIRPSADVPIREKQLGLVLGDFNLTGSSLNGHIFSKAISIFRCFKDSLPDELWEELGRMQDWALEIWDYTKGIHKTQFEVMAENIARQLKQDGRVAVPCGWSRQDGGHAMVVEAFSEGRVRLYNQGSGVRYHRKIQRPFRDRYDAYLEKTEIPAQLLHSPSFWFILLGLKSVRHDNSIEAKDLYDWFIHCLPGKLHNAEIEILPQRSGSCTFKSILAFLKSRMRNDGYDKFILKFKFGILARYEEDLCFRTDRMTLPQQRFLREARNKLQNTLDTMLAAKTVSEELYELLSRYLKYDLELKGDAISRENKIQLTARFESAKVPCSVQDQQQWTPRQDILCTPLEKDLYNVAALCPTPEILSLSAERAQSLKALHQKIQSICLQSPLSCGTLPPSLLPIALAAHPSLNELKDLCEQSSKEDLVTYAKKLYWLLDNCMNVPHHQSGLPQPIAIAWLTECLSIACEAWIRKSTVYEAPIALTANVAQHPLEQPGGLLDGAEHPLSPLGSRLLAEWLQRRAETTKAARPFRIRRASFTDNKPGIRLDFTSSAMRSVIERLSFSPDTNTVSLKDRFPQTWALHAAFISSPFKELISIHSRLCLDLYVTSSVMSEWGSLFAVATNAGNPFSEITPTPSDAPRCLAMTGIVKQVEAMEKDVSLLSVYKPSDTWFRCATIHSSKAAKGGIEIGEASSLGVSPFDVMRKEEAASEYQRRTAELCTKVLQDSIARKDLCKEALALISRINLRLPPEESIELPIHDPLFMALFEDSATADPLARYTLSLPSKPEILERQLLAAYYLRIRSGLEQTFAFTLENLDYLLHNNIEEQGRHDDLWAEAERLATRHPSLPFTTLKENGAPYFGEIPQFQDNNWSTSKYGKVLTDLLGSFTFGPWLLPDKAIYGNRFVRKGNTPDNHLVLQCCSGHAKHINDGYRSTFLANGHTLSMRLKLLGLSSPDQLSPDALYELMDPQNIPDLPDSLKLGEAELWYCREKGQSSDPKGDQAKTNDHGFIIVPDQRKLYCIKRTNRGNAPKARLQVVDLETNAELLTGTLTASSNSSFHWKTRVIQTPRLGLSSSLKAPLEIWAKGGPKSMQIRMGFMSPEFRMVVKRNPKTKKPEYHSLSYPRYKWNPEDSVAELGMLKGMLLTNGPKEILLLTKQRISRSASDCYREEWETQEIGTPYVLHRTVHPDLERHDPLQRLFVCDDPLPYLYLIRELMLQRDWERARAYIDMILPRSSDRSDYSAAVDEFILKPLTLGHPKAAVLQLSAIAKAAEDYTGQQEGWTKALKRLFKKYIDSYHLLDEGWALPLHEELTLANHVDPNKRDSLIQSHIKRAQSVPLEDSVSIHPSPSPASASFWNFHAEGKSGSRETTLGSTDDLVKVRSLYRPDNRLRIVPYVLRRFSEDYSPSQALITCASLWYALHKSPQTQRQLARLIRLKLASAAQKTDTPETPLEIFRDILKACSQTSPLGRSELQEIKTSLVSQSALTEPSESPPSSDKDYRSKRQRQRHHGLGRRIRSLEEGVELTRIRLQSGESSTDAGKEEAELQPGTAQGKRARSTPAAQSAKALKKPVLPIPREIEERFPGLVELLHDPKRLREGIIQTLDEAQEVLTEQKQALLSLQQDPRIGFSQLFHWLASLENEPDPPKENRLASLLISVAQLSAEHATLSRARDALEKSDLAMVEKCLSCCSIIDTPMPPFVKYRLADFIWRKQFALRPRQLSALLHTHAASGILIQGDCGSGKTSVLTPGIGSLSDLPVINVVPHGILRQHHRQLSADAVTRKGTAAGRSHLRRSTLVKDVKRFLPDLKQAQKARIPLVTSLSSLSSLMLGYFEALLSPGAARSAETRPESLDQLLSTLRTGAKLLMDEVDTSAKEEIHWTLGDAVPLPPMRVELTGKLYAALLEMDIESDFGLFHLQGRKRFCKTTYQHETLPKLISRLLDQNLIPEASKNLKRDWIEGFLFLDRGIPDDAAMQINSVLDSLPPEQKQRLLMLRAQLKVYLPHTLGMRYKVDFGPDAKGRCAIPFKAAHLPDPLSRYTYFDILANLTLQWMLRSKPARQDIIAGIREVVRSDSGKAQARAERWLGEEGNVGHFREILEKKGAWKKLLKRIQSSPYARLDIGVEYKLPFISLHSHMLQFTVATLQQMVAKPIGLTATPYNHAGMHEEMATHFLPSPSCEETKEMVQKCPVLGTAALTEEHLSGFAEQEGTHALIDPNASLVEYTNVVLAKTILSGARESIDYVIYWDTESDQWKAWGRKGFTEDYDANRHPNDRCFFFFDQARSRGSDLPIPPHSLTSVLVGPECTFTTLKQAAERCRLFKTGGHKVRFLVEESQWDISPTDGPSLLKNCERNERSLLREELPLLARRQMFEVCRARLIRRIHEHPEDRQQLVGKWRALLIQEVDHNRYQEHADLRKRPSILEDLDQYENALLHEYAELLLPEDKRAIQGYRRRCLTALQDSAKDSSEPALDIRAQAVAASRQATAKSKAMTERSGRLATERRLWDVRPILPKLLRETQEYPDGFKIDFPTNSINGFSKFKTQKLIDLFPRLHAPECLWVTHDALPSMENVFIPGEEHFAESIEKAGLWKRIRQITHLLVVENSYGQPGQASPHFLLTEMEADAALKHLRLMRQSDPFSTANHKVYQSNGRCIFPKNPQEPLDPRIIAVTALFNGCLGAADPGVMDSLDTLFTNQHLDFLRDRLEQYKKGDPRHWEANPLVRKLQESAAKAAKEVPREPSMLDWLGTDAQQTLSVLVPLGADTQPTLPVRDPLDEVFGDQQNPDDWPAGMTDPDAWYLGH